MRRDLTIENETIAVSCYKCATPLVFFKYDNLAESTCAGCRTPLFLPHEVEGIRSRCSKSSNFLEKASHWFLWRAFLSEHAASFKQFVRKLRRRTGTAKGSGRDMSKNKFNTRERQSNLDRIHDSVRSELDELYADMKKLKADLKEGRREASQARKDRIQGIKRALQDLLLETHRIDGLRLAVRDMLDAAERADREWK